MREVYRHLREFLRQYDWVGSVLVYDGPMQGCQFLWREHQVLYVQEEYRHWTTQIIDLVSNKKSGSCLEWNGNKMFVERFTGNPHLVILGGGHISLPLVRIGKLLGFHVTVVDDRTEFANPQRFAEADTIICAAFSEIFTKIPPFPTSYYVVVTRGHQADELCVRQILQKEYAYLGMIGSRQKVAQTIEHLRADGYSENCIASIHAPIGLNIGAVTPTEIAVCIAAEIIQEKNKTAAIQIASDVLDTLCDASDGTLALIIQKAGSAPRAEGARMIVQQGKIVAGTIGGGTIENMARCIAAQMHGKQQRIETFVLRPEESANLGMICGGSNTVYFSSWGL